MGNNNELISELKNLMESHKDVITKNIGHYKPTILTGYQDVSRMKQFNKQIALLTKAVKKDRFKPLESQEFFMTLLSVLKYYKSEISLKAKLEDLNRVYESFANSIDEIFKLMEVN